MWDIHTTTSTSETVVTTIAGPVLSHSIKENGNLYSLTEKCQEVKN